MVCLCCDVITHYVLSCSVTSSEKVDKAQRYADFTLLSIPYPGREPFHGLVKWQASKDLGLSVVVCRPFTLCLRAFWEDLVGQHSTPWLPHIGGHTQGGLCPERGFPLAGAQGLSPGSGTHYHNLEQITSPLWAWGFLMCHLELSMA